MAEITPAELSEQLESDDPPFVLDIRPAEEFADWHVPGSENVDVYEQLKADPEQADEALAAVTVDDAPFPATRREGEVSRSEDRVRIESVQAPHSLRTGRLANSRYGGTRWTTAWVPDPSSSPTLVLPDGIPDRQLAAPAGVPSRDRHARRVG